MESAEAQFRKLYAADGRAVLAYAVRRCQDPEDAADVLAETFLVAWRRLGDVPAGGEAKLWLYGVARRVLANQLRSGRRRERLAERLRDELPAVVCAVSPRPVEEEGGALRAALEQLAAEDREVLLLAAWEQLEPVEIAEVLGVSRVAARSRLHRARARLRAALEEPTALPAKPRPYEEAR